MSAPQTLPPRCSGPHVPVSTEYVPRPPVWDEIGERSQLLIVDDFDERMGREFILEVLDGGGDVEIYRKEWRRFKEAELERLAR